MEYQSKDLLFALCSPSVGNSKVSSLLFRPSGFTNTSL